MPERGRRHITSGKQKKEYLKMKRKQEKTEPLERGKLDLCAHILVVSGARVVLRLQFRFAQELAAERKAAERDLRCSQASQIECTPHQRAELKMQRQIKHIDRQLSASQSGTLKGSEVSTTWRDILHNVTRLICDKLLISMASTSPDLSAAVFLLLQHCVQSGPLKGGRAGNFKRLSDPNDHKAVAGLLTEVQRTVLMLLTESQRKVVNHWVSEFEKRTVGVA